jgi:hypothetical protein
VIARVAVVIAVAGCIDKLEPSVGPPVREVCQNADHDPSRDMRFSVEVTAIIDEYHCRDCHTPTGKTPIGIEVGGLDLSSYDTLRAGGVRSTSTIVVPGQPCQSVLLQKVGEGPPFGSRMPLDGPPYLENADLDAISDWIVEGALDD